MVRGPTKVAMRVQGSHILSAAQALPINFGLQSKWNYRDSGTLLNLEETTKYRWVLSPMNKLVKAWDGAVAMAVIYLSWKVPYAVAFDMKDSGLDYFLV